MALFCPMPVANPPAALFQARIPNYLTPSSISLHFHFQKFHVPVLCSGRAMLDVHVDSKEATSRRTGPIAASFTTNLISAPEYP